MTIRTRFFRHLPIIIAALLPLSLVVARIVGGQFVLASDSQAKVIYPLFIYGHNLAVFLIVVLVTCLLVAMWVVKTMVYWVGLLALMIAPTAVCVTCVMLASVESVQSLQIEDSRYHLAKIEEFDLDLGRVSFIIYRCDRFGTYCVPEYVTDVRPAWESNAKLNFDVHSNQLYLERNGTIIYVRDEVTPSTPIPIRLDNLLSITPQNADKVTQIARLVRGPITKPIWSSDGKSLAIVRRAWSDYGVAGIWLYDASAFDQPPRLWIPQGFEYRTDPLVAFSPNSKYMAAVIYGHMLVWDVLTDIQRVNWQIPEDRYVNNITFHPNNALIAYSSHEHTPTDKKEVVVEIFDFQHLTSQRLYKRLADSSVSDLTFSPDGKFLAIASSGLSLWEISSGVERIFQQSKVATNGFPDYSGMAHTIAFSPDGAFLASANYGASAFIWDVVTGKQVFPLSEPDKGWVSVQIRSVAFSPVSKLVAGVDSDGSLYLWDLSANKLLSSHQGCSKLPGEVVFNPTGTVITMTSEEGVICLWGIPSSN